MRVWCGDVVAVCSPCAGGKTPDISSERRTFADVMTDAKLKATEVRSVVGFTPSIQNTLVYE